MPVYIKTTEAGNVIETEVYRSLRTRRSNEKMKDRPILRSPNQDKTNEKQAEYNKRLARQHFQRLINTNFSWRNSLYVTLTYEGQEPSVDNARKAIDNYIRRLRRQSPHLKYIVTTGRKNKERIHHHLLLANVQAKQIADKWTFGKIKKIEALYKKNFDADGQDCGEDYSRLANYMFKHCKDIKGKKWKQSRNLVQPLVEIKERKYDKRGTPKAKDGFVLLEKYENDSDYIGVYRYYKYIKMID